MKLYDLAGAEDDLRFSPNCWRIKMALEHKGLAAETVPWRFVEKDVIAFSGQKAVPVLVDGEKVVSDSWEIARYLEHAYSDKPSLFGGPAGEGLALFVKFWCEQTLNRVILRLILPDLFRCLHEKDKAYFRESREARFGTTLEQYALPSAAGVPLLVGVANPAQRLSPELAISAAGDSAAPAVSSRCATEFRRLHSVRLVPVGARSIAGGSAGVRRSSFRVA